MEWVVGFGFILTALALLWGFIRIGAVTEATRKAGEHLGRLEIARKRHAEDIACLSGSVRSLTDRVCVPHAGLKVPTALAERR